MKEEINKWINIWTKNRFRQTGTYLYTPVELNDLIDDYLEYLELNPIVMYSDRWSYKKKKPLTVPWFCNYIGVNKVYMNRIQKESYEFQQVVHRLYTLVEQDLLEYSLVWQFDNKIASLILTSHHGYSDKTNVNIGWQEGNPVVIENINKMSGDEIDEAIRNLLDKKN